MIKFLRRTEPGMDLILGSICGIMVAVDVGDVSDQSHWGRDEQELVETDV